MVSALLCFYVTVAASLAAPSVVAPAPADSAGPAASSQPPNLAEKKPQSPAAAKPAANGKSEPTANGAKTNKPAKPEKPDAPLASKLPEPIPAAPADASPAPEASATLDPDDEVAVENAEAEVAAIARPVTPDPIQIYGWRENIRIKGVEEKCRAKLDTGALTSSIHAEEKELFERDGKKWVRFIVTDPSMKKPVRTRIEAPLVRIAKIKEPGGESVSREVVRLSFELGERKMRGEFTLNNRVNMLSPVLIGRNMIKELGWVDPGRVNLADQKIFR